MAVLLDDGSEIALIGRPAQGTRHDVLFGPDGAGGDGVVVKIERIPGTLANERIALQWCNGRSRLVPQLRRVSAVPLPDGRSAVCLIMDRAPGAAPADDAGWRRMGTALAQWSTIAWEGFA